MKRTILSVVLATSLAASAYGATAQTAPADNPPPAHALELARQMVTATGIGNSLTATMRSMVAQTYASLPPAPTAEAEARRQVFADAQADATARMIPKVMDIMVDAYARNFTEQELTDVLAFYQSPSGRSMVAKMPVVLQSVSSELIALLPGVRRDMGDEICAKVTCSKAERGAFYGAPARP